MPFHVITNLGLASIQYRPCLILSRLEIPIEIDTKKYQNEWLINFMPLTIYQNVIKLVFRHVFFGF